MTYEKIRPEGYEKIPFDTMVSLGNFPRYQADTKFGYNPAVGSSQEEIWFAGGSLSYLSAAETMNIVSTDTDDDGAPAGTGARTVQIFGLGNNYDEISEIVTMNGTTNVLTTQAYIRVTRMIVVTAGSGEANAGNITATASTAATTQALIQAGENQSAKIQFSVPSNKVCVINTVNVSVGSGTDALFRVKVRDFGAVFRTIRLVDTRRSANNFEYRNGIVLDEKSDFTITAAVASGTPSVAAYAEYWLVDKREMA